MPLCLHDPDTQKTTSIMTPILIIALLAVAALLALASMKMKRLKDDVDKLRVVVDNQDNYTFLIDQTFEVKESNVKLADGQPRLLGNVLHCKNSHETGHCGEGTQCKHCPVRFVISKSFERHDDFRNLEASMLLDDSDKAQSDIDVSIDGSFVCIDQTPHMVVNVKSIVTREGGVLPKVLFLSQNAALYDKVRKALGISYRVLSVDTEHQALHRLLHAKDYNFCAVMTDAPFYHQNNAVSLILSERKDKLPVFVFAKKDERVADSTVNYLDENLKPEELLKLITATAA